MESDRNQGRSCHLHIQHFPDIGSPLQPAERPVENPEAPEQEQKLFERAFAPVLSPTKSQSGASSMPGRRPKYRGVKNTYPNGWLSKSFALAGQRMITKAQFCPDPRPAFSQTRAPYKGINDGAEG